MEDQETIILHNPLFKEDTTSYLIRIISLIKDRKEKVKERAKSDTYQMISLL